MSRLDGCCTPEQELARQLARLISLKSDVALKNEKVFESKLFALLNEYGFSLKDAINILNSQAGDAAPITVSSSVFLLRDFQLPVRKKL